MAKMSRKELRRELRELIFPVITHLHELLENGKATNVLDFEHRGEKIQAQFHANEKGLAIYILYWHGVTVAFKVSPEELSTVLAKSVEWYSDKFVELNETLIGRVCRSKPTLH